MEDDIEGESICTEGSLCCSFVNVLQLINAANVTTSSSFAFHPKTSNAVSNLSFNIGMLQKVNKREY